MKTRKDESDSSVYDECESVTSSAENLNSITSTNLEIPTSTETKITMCDFPPVYDAVTMNHSDEDSPPSYTAATSQVSS